MRTVKNTRTAKHSTTFFNFAWDAPAEMLASIDELPINDFLSWSKGFSAAYDDLGDKEKLVYAAQINRLLQVIYARVQEISEKAIYEVNGSKSNSLGEATVDLSAINDSITALINKVNANEVAIATKQNKLIAGENITLTPNADNTTTIASSGGSGIVVTEVLKPLNYSALSKQLSISGFAFNDDGTRCIEIGYGYGNGQDAIAIGLNMSSSGCEAYEYAIAIGHATTASAYSFAIGNQCISPEYAGSIGHSAHSSTVGQIKIGGSYYYNSRVNNQSIVGSSGWAVASDARDKADIADLPLGLDFIRSLRPVEYRVDERKAYMYENVTTMDENNKEVTQRTKKYESINDVVKDGTHKGTRLHSGFLTQEIKKSLDDLNVDYAMYQDNSFSGGEDSQQLVYTELIAPLVKAVQELSVKVDALQEEIKALKGE